MNHFVNNKALQLTLREMRAVFTNHRTIGALAATSVILAISGPFQTFESLSVVVRFVYWTATTFITFSIGSFFGTWMSNATGGWSRFGPGQLVLVSLASGLPVCLLVVVINALTFDDFIVTPEVFGIVALYCIGISAIVSSMYALFNRTNPKDIAARPVRLLQRVPLAKRGALVSLSVQDHYVAITTTKGTEMVLMRLSDAIAEAENVEGLQIHRSHWIALKGIAATHKRQGKLLMETVNGEELPVSRTYVAAVKEAGLIT